MCRIQTLTIGDDKSFNFDKNNGYSMIFGEKSYYIRINGAKPLSAFPYQSDFIAGFTLVAVHDFHVAHRGGDAFMRHYTLYGTDICTGSPLKVANVLRYEWNVMFLVIPAERIHSFMGACVQLRISP